MELYYMLFKVFIVSCLLSIVIAALIIRFLYYFGKKLNLLMEGDDEHQTQKVHRPLLKASKKE